MNTPKQGRASLRLVRGARPPARHQARAGVTRFPDPPYYPARLPNEQPGDVERNAVDGLARSILRLLNRLDEGQFSTESLHAALALVGFYINQADLEASTRQRWRGVYHREYGDLDNENP